MQLEYLQEAALMPLCETIIYLDNNPQKEFKTRGLDSDQTVSAIKATEKMLNII